MIIVILMLLVMAAMAAGLTWIFLQAFLAVGWIINPVYLFLVIFLIMIWMIDLPRK